MVLAKFIRLLAAVVVLVFIAYTFHSLNDNLDHNLERAMNDLHSTSDEALNLITDSSLGPVTTPSPTTPQVADSCECKIKEVFGGSFIVQDLELVMAWLKMTSLEYLVKHHPNLPVDLIYNVSRTQSCGLLPSIFSIEWVNKYWQRVVLGNTSILLYSAVYDINPGGEPCVRMLGVTRSTNPPAGWCHLWFNPQQPPVVAKVTKIDYLDYQGRSGDHQMPFMFTCPLPSQAAHLQPGAVSLVNQPCQPATTLLQVVGAKEREASAYQHGQQPADPTRAVTGWVPAVCGPALYYYHNDFSKRLVEWLEILRAEGFGRVFLYTANVHPNIEKVLNYYVDDGFVQLTRYSYPPPYINEPSIQRFWTLVERKKMFAQENIYFTDCLLRHMHQYRFIAHYDPDELPILLKHHNYTHFLDHLTITTRNEKPKRKRKTPAAYRLRWNNFYSDLEPQGEAAELPEYLWILRHTRRTVQNLGVTSVNFKALYDMNTVRGVFSHGVLVCTTGTVNMASRNDCDQEKCASGIMKYLEARKTPSEPCGCIKGTKQSPGETIKRMQVDGVTFEVVQWTVGEETITRQKIFYNASKEIEARSRVAKKMFNLGSTMEIIKKIIEEGDTVTDSMMPRIEDMTFIKYRIKNKATIIWTKKIRGCHYEVVGYQNDGNIVSGDSVDIKNICFLEEVFRNYMTATRAKREDLWRDLRTCSVKEAIWRIVSEDNKSIENPTNK